LFFILVSFLVLFTGTVSSLVAILSRLCHEVVMRLCGNYVDGNAANRFGATAHADWTREIRALPSSVIRRKVMGGFRSAFGVRKSKRR
jgi:hypothetical protein